VKFHDGRPFTPEDARQSLLHHMGEGSTSGALAIVSQITDIAVEGEDRLIVTLGQGNAEFPALMSDFHLSVFPAKEGGGIDWESGIGTGAFRLDSFEPGIATRLTRNPNYHKENKPYLDEIIRLIDPQIVLLTGGVSMRSVLNETKLGITKVRGQWYQRNGRWIMPIFHPAYLLRNPEKTTGSPKALMWQDIQEVRRKYDELDL